MTLDQRLLDDDVQARKEALDISRSFIVQAPAGSGKTELLIQRYLKLLAVVEDPEEILAITFTRKAAAEMEFRVLDALKRARRCERPELDHQALTFELAVAALDRDTSNAWHLIENPRRMRIQTLDSLSAAIARSRPLSAPESASGTRIVVDAELRYLYRAAALATLDWLGESGAAGDATREVLVHVDNNTAAYVSHLARMLGTRDQWLPFIGTGLVSTSEADELRARFERNIVEVVTGHLQKTARLVDPALVAELAPLADYAAGNLAAGDVESPVRGLRGLAARPAPDTGAIKQWDGLAELLLTKTGTFRKKVDKRQGFPAGDSGQKADFHALLERLADNEALARMLHRIRSLPPLSYSDEQWQVLLALFRLLPVTVIELKQLFAERGVSDHIEVALTASGALGSAEAPGDIALLLDYQVRHILVDEMQDTSSAQYRMLEALTGGWQPGDGRTLFCVGDPMQSIYRFRNAEVGQFLLARESGIGETRLESLLLRRNFRSGAFLVDWFNTVFPTILADEDDPSSGAVSYSEAVGVPQLAGQGDVVLHPLFGSSGAQEAAAGCDVIARTLAENPDDEMAVLVRGRTQLPALLAQLRRAGISYRAVEIDRLTDLPEVLEVVALTRAAVHQGDRLAWLGLLRAPWIGLHWTDLHALVVNDRDSTVWQLLQDEDRLAALSSEGREAIEAAMPALAMLVAPRRSSGLRDLVEEVWMHLGGPAILDDEFAVANVYRYFDVIGKHEHRGSLTDVADLESLLDLERVSSDVSARLQVMTMHRAKGLEFEHVLLYGLGRIPGSGRRSVLSWFDVPDEHGDERKIISPVGPRADIERDPLHQFIALADADKDFHEQARLLYVACTRARKSLHLMGHTGISPDGESLKPPTSGTLLRLLWPAVENQYTAALDGSTGVADSDADVWIDPVLRRLSSPWSLPDVLALPGVVDREAITPDEKVEFYWVGTEARIAGTILHRWLQLFAQGRASADLEALSRYRPVTQRWLRELGVGDTMNDAVNDRVDEALRGMLSDDKGKWILDGDGYAEFALTGFHNGRVESVVLDRVRIDESGEHWIIDYKTSSHEGGNLPGFLDAECRRYRPQLEQYATIYEAYAGVTPRCALYFPLLQQFIEI